MRLCSLLFNHYGYSLPKEKWSAYVGHYSAFGKSNPLFNEMSLAIRIREDDELELLASKSGVLKGHYKLQYINETSAVLRSIAHPREIQFKLYSKGTIGGLYMFGSEFKKKNELVETRYETEHGPNQSVSFLFPKSANTTWNANQFTANFDNHAAAQFELEISPLSAGDFETFVNEKLNCDLQTKQHYLFVQYQDPVAKGKHKSSSTCHGVHFRRTCKKSS